MVSLQARSINLNIALDMLLPEVILNGMDFDCFAHAVGEELETMDPNGFLDDAYTSFDEEVYEAWEEAMGEYEFFNF